MDPTVEGSADPSSSEDASLQLGDRYALGSSSSSSTSAAIPMDYKYEVFLSSSYWDSGGYFGLRLCNHLKMAGIHAFWNNDMIDRDHKLVLPAMQQSNISIPIFSKAYGSSSRCLSVAAQMVKCMKTTNQLILPIFYNVSPNELRHQTGRYYDAFSDHEKKHPLGIVEEWRSALSEISKLKGWDLTQNSNRSEFNIFTAIKKKVLKYRLRARNIVGMDDHEEAIMGLLDIAAPAARTIGIWGMGGIGKTTIAKYVYGRLKEQFDYSFSSIDDDSQGADGMTFRQRLFADDGDPSLGHSFQDKKVLVLLDDVDKKKIGKLRNLVKNFEKCGQRSRAVVTTREKSIMDESGVQKTYEVPEMHEHNAFTLFCKHAFNKDSPPPTTDPNWVQLSWQIVRATGRLPLAVETMGSYLAFKSEDTWRNALTDLETKGTIEDKLKESLEISYNALSEKEQQLFLDIGCIFIGMDRRIPLHAWKALGIPPESLDILHLRSLIKIRDDGTLWMHDHLRDLGMDIVRRKSQGELGMQSRLWCNEDVMKVLKSDKATSMIEAIHMNSEPAIEPGCFIGQKLKKLSNLWYLGLANAVLAEDLQGCLPNLRWLSWQVGKHLDMPRKLNLEKLMVLDLSKSKITKDWPGWSIFKGALHLEVLNLSGCHQLTETTEFSAFLSVKRLILEDCIELREVHKSLGDLKSLEFLNLRNCKKLKDLPLEFECLHSLIELLIDGSSIQSIPISSGMKKLEILSARSCKSLAEIPECIAQLESLRELSLSGTTLTFLPDSVGELHNLEELNIDQCLINTFPSCVGKLEMLRVLNASWCLNMTGDVPPEVENLKYLRILRLDHTSITSIPASLAGLSHLDTLDLEWCTKLRSIPDLPPSLVNLKVTRPASSKGVPNLAELINLKQLELVKYNSPVVLAEPDEDPSSSTSSASEFEVFLSFRGPDVRDTFVSYLFMNLEKAGIRVFKDDKDLPPGVEFGPELLRAIEQSNIFMPIFSKDYASSKWCLREATHVMEKYDMKKKQRQQILPIFYDIAPNDVGNQRGTYEAAFAQHDEEKKHGDSTVEKWREALRRIGKMEGWDFTNSSNSDKGAVIDEVVREALKQLKKPFLDVTKNLVGIEDHVEKVMDLLDIRASDVRMVGIWGMSGIGKTTVAKFIYNQIADQFQYCCFLDNIGDTSRQHKGLESLQARLASSLLRRPETAFASVDEGVSKLQDRLKSKKALILLDDVDDISQLNALARDLKWFGEGSRIIITTRKRDVLEKLRAKSTTRVEEFGAISIYNVTELQPLKAFSLFCKHAFGQNSSVPPHLAQLARDISDATGGLPLAIEAIGSSLSFRTKYDREDTSVWQEALHTLETAKEIQDKLMVSYKALSNQEKEVFLDIACLFVGMDKKIPIHTWEAQGYRQATTILQNLQLRSLIKIGDDNTLWMHDCHRDLAREIVRRKASYELAEQSRVWCREDATEVLTNKKGTEKVKAIYLDRGMKPGSDEPLSSRMFKGLPNLWFLELGDSDLVKDSQRSLPCLKWLCWHGQSPLNIPVGCAEPGQCFSRLKWLSWHGQNLLNVPVGFGLKNLIVLDLSESRISEDWTGWSMIKMASKLEVLNLAGCRQLKRTPDLSSFEHMKKLIVRDCRELAEIDRSIGCLQTLELLDMRHCKNIRKMPEELGCVKSLTELLVDETGIQEIPISGDMAKLEILSARFSRSLTRIPPSIGKLKSLKELSLSHTGVIDLPDDIGMLSKLVVLNVDNCAIGALPPSLEKLEKLEEIDASGCLNLTGGVPDLERLQRLRILRLDQTKVTKIPESISKLPHLQTLGLKDCRKLVSLPDLPPSLVDLKVRCTASVTIPNIPALINLKQLEVQICGEHARVLKDIDTFSKIDKLSITIKPAGM